MFRALAVQGAKALHTGKYAQNIVSVVQNAKDNPGQLSLQDLSDYQVVERPPVCVTYRIYEVCGMSAPSSGIAVGQILGILNEFSPNQVGVMLKACVSWAMLLGLRLRIVMYI